MTGLDRNFCIGPRLAGNNHLYDPAAIVGGAFSRRIEYPTEGTPEASALSGCRLHFSGTRHRGCFSAAVAHNAFSAALCLVSFSWLAKAASLALRASTVWCGTDCLGAGAGGACISEVGGMFADVRQLVDHDLDDQWLDRAGNHRGLLRGGRRISDQSAGSESPENPGALKHTRHWVSHGCLQCARTPWWWPRR